MTGITSLGTDRRRRTFPTKSSLRAPLGSGNAGRLHGDPGRREVVGHAAQTKGPGRAGLGSVLCWICVNGSSVKVPSEQKPGQTWPVALGTRP